MIRCELPPAIRSHVRGTWRPDHFRISDATTKITAPPAVPEPDQDQQRQADAGADQEADARLAEKDADKRAGEQRDAEQEAAGERGIGFGSHAAPMAAATREGQPK
jgi:hypothetical protein